LVELTLAKNISSVDIQLHFYFEDPTIHSMDAIVFNECERQFINAIKNINKYIDESLEIEIFAREEGGLIDKIKIIVKHPLVYGLVIAIATAFFTAQFRPKLSIEEQTKYRVETIQTLLQLEEAGKLSEDIFDYIVNNDKELRKLKSNFFKSVKKEVKLTKVEVGTPTLVAGNPVFSKITVSYKQFDDFILSESEDEDKILMPNVDDKARIFIIAPVLIKDNASEWKGYYGGLPIKFKVSDDEFLEQIYSHEIKFGSGTYIDCKLIRYTTIKGETKKETITYEVADVSELNDDENFKIPIKRRKKEAKNTDQGLLSFDEDVSE
jgi:hypothetical protein